MEEQVKDMKPGTVFDTGRISGAAREFGIRLSQLDGKESVSCSEKKTRYPIVIFEHIDKGMLHNASWCLGSIKFETVSNYYTVEQFLIREQRKQ